MAEGLQPLRRLGDLRVADRLRPVRRYADPQHPEAHPVANRPASPVCPRPAPLELEPWHALPCPVIEIVRSTFALTLSPGHHPVEGDRPGVNQWSESWKAGSRFSLNAPMPSARSGWTAERQCASIMMAIACSTG